MRLLCDSSLNSCQSRAGEPEPVGAGYFWLLGAGAAKKLAGSSALLEDKKHKINVY